MARRENEYDASSKSQFTTSEYIIRLLGFERVMPCTEAWIAIKILAIVRIGISNFIR